jgi:hypothetical protein
VRSLSIASSVILSGRIELGAQIELGMLSLTRFRLDLWGTHMNVVVGFESLERYTSKLFSLSIIHFWDVVGWPKPCSTIQC